MALIRLIIVSLVVVLLSTVVTINGDELAETTSQDVKSTGPVVTVSPDKISVYRNSGVLIYCNFYDTVPNALIQVTWVHGLTDVDVSSSHYKADKAFPDGLQLEVKNMESHYLHIKNVSPSDAGQYKCRVTVDNVTGVSENTVDLTVLEPEVKPEHTE